MTTPQDLQPGQRVEWADGVSSPELRHGTLTALIPVEVTIGHDDITVDVQLLGEATGNPDLAVIPDVSGTREYDDWDEPVDFTGWTVVHLPTRHPVVAVSFTLDDARHFAVQLEHLNWSHVTRADARRGEHPYAPAVKAALAEVMWW